MSKEHPDERTVPNRYGIRDSYIGGGIYLSWTGTSILLDLRAQPPTTPITQIAMEPRHIDALVEYRDQLIEKLKGQG